MNFKWGIFRWHFCYPRHLVGAITQKFSFSFQAFKNFTIIPMPKLHVADSTVTLYSIMAFPLKFKKHLRLNMAFVILYFSVY